MRPAVAAAIVALLGTACLVPLDRRPPRRAFAQSKARLTQAGARIAADSGPVEVGWGRAEIVAPEGASLAGYGSRAGEPHQGVHDRTFARAIAISAGGAPVVFLALDLLLLDPISADRLAARVSARLPRERLIVTASHTHGGMGGYASGFPWTLVFGGHREDASRALLDAAEAAIGAALDGLEPGRFALGEVAAPGLAKNRVRRSGAPVDDVAALLLLERARDGARAVLVSYAAHATTVSDRDPRLTADYPGVMSRALEADGLALAAFSAGAVGSMAPRAGWSEHPGAAWTGSGLAAAVRRALPTLGVSLRDHSALAVLRFALATPPRQWRLFAEWVVPGAISGTFAPAELHLQAVSFGAETWVALPVELSGEISARLRRRARARGTRLVITVFNGEYGGYVVPRSAYDLPDQEKGEMADYESRLMSMYGPWMGDLIAAGAWRAALSAEDAALARGPAPPPAPMIFAAEATNPPPEVPEP